MYLWNCTKHVVLLFYSTARKNYVQVFSVGYKKEYWNNDINWMMLTFRNQYLFQFIVSKCPLIILMLSSRNLFFYNPGQVNSPFFNEPKIQSHVCSFLLLTSTWPPFFNSSRLESKPIRKNTVVNKLVVLKQF